MGRIEVVKKKEKGDLGEVEKRSLGHPKLEAELGRWGLKVLTQCIIVCSSWSNMTLSVHDANDDNVGLRAVPSLEQWLCWHFCSLPRLFVTIYHFSVGHNVKKKISGEDSYVLCFRHWFHHSGLLSVGISFLCWPRVPCVLAFKMDIQVI